MVNSLHCNPQIWLSIQHMAIFHSLKKHFLSSTSSLFFLFSVPCFSPHLHRALRVSVRKICSHLIKILW